MDGQMNLFDFIPRTTFCWDEDINKIVAMLDDLIENNSDLLSSGKKEFTVWDHVPQYGFRLSYTVYVPLSMLQDERMDGILDEIIQYGEKHNIEISPMTTGLFNPSAIYVFSTFCDNRKKRKIA